MGAENRKPQSPALGVSHGPLRSPWGLVPVLAWPPWLVYARGGGRFFCISGCAGRSDRTAFLSRVFPKGVLVLPSSFMLFSHPHSQQHPLETSRQSRRPKTLALRDSFLGLLPPSAQPPRPQTPLVTPSPLPFTTTPHLNIGPKGPYPARSHAYMNAARASSPAKVSDGELSAPASVGEPTPRPQRPLPRVFTTPPSLPPPTAMLFKGRPSPHVPTNAAASLQHLFLTNTALARTCTARGRFQRGGG
jgi:hypothetical protein